MRKRNRVAHRHGVDMSNDAIARRIREAAELMRLGLSLARARFVGKVRERRPDWGKPRHHGK